MELEIKEIIAKNLPAHVGDVLKTRLEQADKNDIKIEVQTKELEAKDKTIRELEKTIRDYSALDQRNSQLSAREKEVEDKERDLKIKTLEYQLDSEKDKTKFSQDVALGLVRNSEYRRSLFDNISEPGKDQYGNYVYNNKTQNSEETKTVK